MQRQNQPVQVRLSDSQKCCATDNGAAENGEIWRDRQRYLWSRMHFGKVCRMLSNRPADANVTWMQHSPMKMEDDMHVRLTIIGFQRFRLLTVLRWTLGTARYSICLNCQPGFWRQLLYKINGTRWSTNELLRHLNFMYKGCFSSAMRAVFSSTAPWPLALRPKAPRPNTAAADSLSRTPPQP